MNSFNFIGPSSSNIAPTPPRSGTLKLFMEDIEKTPSLSGKCVKIQAYIETIKTEKDAMKDLNYPIGKQCLDDAIKTLEVEHDKYLAQIKDILNRTRITDASISPEEMIKVFQNLSLTPTNVQPAHMLMEQGLHMQMRHEQKLGQMLPQQLQNLLQKQQGLRQQPF